MPMTKGWACSESWSVHAAVGRRPSGCLHHTPCPSAHVLRTHVRHPGGLLVRRAFQDLRRLSVGRLFGSVRAALAVERLVALATAAVPIHGPRAPSLFPCSCRAAGKAEKLPSTYRQYRRLVFSAE